MLNCFFKKGKGQFFPKYITSERVSQMSCPNKQFIGNWFIMATKSTLLTHASHSSYIYIYMIIIYKFVNIISRHNIFKINYFK